MCSRAFFTAGLILTPRLAPARPGTTVTNANKDDARKTTMPTPQAPPAEEVAESVA